MSEPSAGAGVAQGEAGAPPSETGEAVEQPGLAPIELLGIALGTIYLVGPWRRLPGDVVVFLLGVAAIFWLRDRLPTPTRAESGSGRWPHALLAGGTLAGALALLAYGVLAGSPAFRPATIALVIALYLPFAYLQQWLTQRYLVGRLGQLVAGRLRRGELCAVAVGGLLFGLAHLPFPALLPPTLAMGVLWSWAHLRGARLAAISLSHALLGGLYFLAILGKDPFTPLIG